MTAPPFCPQAASPISSSVGGCGDGRQGRPTCQNRSLGPPCLPVRCRACGSEHRVINGRAELIARDAMPRPPGPPTGGKSDPLDAIEAARAAMSGRACGAAKTRDGNVEAIRALVVANRPARSVNIKTLNQIRHLSSTAPEELRQPLAGAARRQLAARAVALRPGQRQGADRSSSPPRPPCGSSGAGCRPWMRRKPHLDALLSELVTQTAPDLLALYGMGIGRRLAGHRRGQPGPAAVRGRLGAPVRHRAHPGPPRAR
jgi:hypothetical protein